MEQLKFNFEPESHNEVKPRHDFPAAESNLATPETQSETANKIEEAGALLEQLLELGNITRAKDKVIANKGSAGIDKMSVRELNAYLSANWQIIASQIREGKYKPQPVRRVEIPKATGGKRPLGIPTAIDRVIQQAIFQILEPVFEPGFSENSFGFRPKRSAHDAVRRAKQYQEEGFRYVVDIDLEKFFDKVNHDVLMSRLARKVTDKKILKLIRAYLTAGVMINGVKVKTDEGTPQGGPLSPFLSNILLDELDKELEKRGHKFCRYADDCNIYVKSLKAGLRVKAGVTAFLQRKLKLKVNETKSAVDLPSRRKFLGFSFMRLGERVEITIAKESIRRMKDKIRRITNPVWTISIRERIGILRSYLNGWLRYFALADEISILGRLSEWIRRRLRLCLWSNWKRIRTRVRELIRYGASRKQAFRLALTQKGAWRTARNPLVHRFFNNQFWKKLGFTDLLELYSSFRMH